MCLRYYCAGSRRVVENILASLTYIDLKTLFGYFDDYLTAFL